ncbi:SRPBCC family protein [Zavarzinella formosa]|uniref:SRPBCC family protein n=1 Tax=Zavarzinella formosa TaxID=360055 RepID=UPI0002EE62F9|nr:SRPBCC family protein [Zavarzinella formosa]
MRNTLKVTTPTDREIVMTRTFDAPRPLLFEALSKPEFLKRWLLGPPGWSMVTCEEDMKVGGLFRYAWRNEDGQEMAMTGAYREVVAPERVVRTEHFEFGCAPQAGEQVVTLHLAEQGDKTKLTITMLFPSKEARDGMVASGMEHGVAASYDRLDDLLAVAVPQ